MDPVPHEPVPQEPGTRAPEAPLPSAEATSARLAVARAGAAAAGMRGAGLADLEAAFLANAQALEGVSALQVRLLEALQRGDRSELVLANVRGLNEAFRGLSSVQERLLERLAQPPPSPGGRALPLLLLGLCGVLVLCTWALVGAIQRHGDQQPDPGLATEQAASLLQAGREEAARGAREEAARLAAQLGDSEQRTRSLQERLDAEREAAAERAREISSKEAEVDGLRRQVAAAQNEAVKLVALENEIKLLTQESALVEPRMRGLEREVDEQRRENTELRKRLAAYAMGLEEPPAREPVPAPSAPAGVQAPASGAGVPLAAQLPPPRDLPAMAPEAPGTPALPVAPEASRVPPPAAGSPERPRNLAARAPLAPAPGAPPPSAPPPAAEPPAAEPAAGPSRGVAPVAPPAGALRGTDGEGLASAARPVSRDPAALESVRGTLNTLLAGAGARRPDGWTFTRIDGVAQDRLRGVRAERRDASGLLLETVEAAEAGFTLEAATRRVTLELVQGVRSTPGGRAPARESRIEAVVAEGEAAALFARSGLQVVRAR
ncbi:MAG: hypothetical protein ACKOSS_09895 [Planctomycetia bacterium]